jgi:hypothetical protein
MDGTTRTGKKYESVLLKVSTCLLLKRKGKVWGKVMKGTTVSGKFQMAPIIM